MEFFDFTEFAAGSIVTVVSSGNPMPAAIPFDASTPSTDPASPSCSSGALECFEGMLVSIASGAVTGGNQSFGSDPLAEIHITAAPTRTYREPGIEYPGPGGSIPEWDGNPEVFELDPDKLGLANQEIPGGSTFTATGVVGFEFGDYELWPTALNVSLAPMPRAVRARNEGEVTIASYNLYRFATDGQSS